MADLRINFAGIKSPNSFCGLNRAKDFLAVSGNLETSMPGIYAGGDAIREQRTASTVIAVQDGKRAAAIHSRLITEAS